jgi:hypothetical protein
MGVPLPIVGPLPGHPGSVPEPAWPSSLASLRDRGQPVVRATRGISMGPGTRSNTVGGSSAALQDLILNSGGPGVILRSSSGNAVLGNSISNNAGGGVVVIAGRNNVIGSAAAGNAINGNGRNGLSVTGLVTGTRVQGNAIAGNAGNGVALFRARRLTVGGNTPGSGNAITGNHGYGLFASGACCGTVVRRNVIVANARGNVHLAGSRGIRFIPG